MTKALFIPWEGKDVPVKFNRLEDWSCDISEGYHSLKLRLVKRNQYLVLGIFYDFSWFPNAEINIVVTLLHSIIQSLVLSCNAFNERFLVWAVNTCVNLFRWKYTCLALIWMELFTPLQLPFLFFLSSFRFLKNIMILNFLFCPDCALIPAVGFLYVLSVMNQQSQKLKLQGEKVFNLILYF